MKRESVKYIMVIVLLTLSFSLFARTDKTQTFDQTKGEPHSAIMNINNWLDWVYWDGRSSISPVGQSGGAFPLHQVGVIFQDGLVWGGIVQDPNPEKPQIRVGGQTYFIGTVPGRIVSPGNAQNPDDEAVRVYRIRKDYETLSDTELRVEASEYFRVDISVVTQDQMDHISSQYSADWDNWPVEYGAPFNDDNNNGVFEPDLGEDPGIKNADQVIWFVVNDLDETATYNMYGSPSMGLELQVTWWAYEALPKVMFRRYRLVNKSEFAIDSMYLSMWSDPDVGAPFDDFAGCDIENKLGYAYNCNPSDYIFDQFGLSPAAYGYTLLQGPVIYTGSDLDTAYFDFKKKPGYVNLPMTSFSYFSSGSSIQDPVNGDYLNGTLPWYNLLNGYLPENDTLNPSPYITGSGPNQGQPTKFPLSGDPVNDPNGTSGDVDGAGNNFSDGDRRMLISTGDFTMAPGEAQEIIVGVIGGYSSSNLASITDMKGTCTSLQSSYSSWIDDIIITGVEEQHNVFHSFELKQNYPNPFNPVTTIEYNLKVASDVKLQIYNALGQNVATLVNQRQTANSYHVEWNANSIPSGIYYYRLEAGENTQIKKMLLIK